jgi:CRP-like cAMP-binding protein
VANFAELPAGFALTQEGEKSTRFCLLWQGSVAVTKRGPGGEGPEVTLAVIKADAEMPYFGENCILSAQIEAPAGASVSTREPSQMFIIYREAAAEVLKTLPEFGNILLERKAMLRKTNKRLVEGASVGRMPAR